MAQTRPRLPLIGPALVGAAIVLAVAPPVISNAGHWTQATHGLAKTGHSVTKGCGLFNCDAHLDTSQVQDRRIGSPVGAGATEVSW